MHTSKAVLLCLDEPCTPLRRTWCLWECSLAVQHKGPSVLICLPCVPPGTRLRGPLPSLVSRACAPWREA